MLTRLGRIEEAVEAAATEMTSAEEASALVQTLKQQGALEQALKREHLSLAFVVLSPHGEHL